MQSVGLSNLGLSFDPRISSRSFVNRYRRLVGCSQLMRQAVALLLLCSLSMHCAGRLGIVARWWLNREYVAQVLCINRDKPKLQCNGKCHLVKQLKAAEEPQQPQSATSKQAFQEITLFCSAWTSVHVVPASGFPEAPCYAELLADRYAWCRPGPDHPPALS